MNRRPTIIIIIIVLICASCPDDPGVTIVAITHSPDPTIAGDMVTFAVQTEPGEGVEITLDLDNNGTFFETQQGVFHFIGDQTIQVKATHNGYVVTESYTFPVYPVFTSSIEKVIIPDLQMGDGGLQPDPAPSGDVYYYNSLGTREESDIQLYDPLSYTMTARGYLHVGGYAVPDDSGSSDTFYHSVLFWASLKDEYGNTVETHYYTFPVDSENRFDGYIYFREPGRYLVYSLRYFDVFLYPRLSKNDNWSSTIVEHHHTKNDNWSSTIVEHWSRGSVAVDEWAATLRFEVYNTYDIPGDKEHLIGTRDIDCGTKAIRDKADEITLGSTSDPEKVRALYEFVVFGELGNEFIYAHYDEIYPGYLSSSSYADIFIASHFLEQRRGVCNDFAELYAALARSLGFHVQTMRGENTSNGAAHRWNLLSLDNGSTWLRIDTTFSNLHKDDSPDYYKKYGEIFDEFDEALFLADIENYYDYKDPAYPVY
jgi:transglutaminase-like putative cysteine protease